MIFSVEIKKKDLHQDLLFECERLSIIKALDTYYFSLDNNIEIGNKKGDERIYSSLMSLLSNWIHDIEKTINEKTSCFLPIDFSDQYIAGISFLYKDDVYGEIAYGDTLEIMGMEINPSSARELKVNKLNLDTKYIEVELKQIIETINNNIVYLGSLK